MFFWITSIKLEITTFTSVWIGRVRIVLARLTILQFLGSTSNAFRYLSNDYKNVDMLSKTKSRLGLTKTLFYWTLVQTSPCWNDSLFSQFHLISCPPLFFSQSRFSPRRVLNFLKQFTFLSFSSFSSLLFIWSNNILCNQLFGKLLTSFRWCLVSW